MVIDFHTHVFSPDIKKNRKKYIDNDPCFAILYSDPKARLVTADELIKSMDESGVDISVILNIGWITHDLCVETNDYILDAIARYPDRLIGFCAVQPQSYDAAVDEIERCARGGARGIGELRPDTQLLDFSDREMIDPLIEVIMKHNLILLTHTSEPVGHDYPGKGNVTPDMIYPLITGYPELTLVCSHWGGGLPFYAMMPEVKETMRRVFFDTAASPLLYTPQIYQQVSQLVGADKILFGSDYPVIPPGRILDEVRAADLPEATKDLMLSGNARRLLNITDD
ncbi:amidohydrolase family protein [Chloroflexota bacterium]